MIRSSSFSFSCRSKPQRENASILMEALMASVVLTLVAATVAPLFTRHIELAKRAQNLDLVEAVVNRDINALRHYSRFWKAFSGPYSDDILQNSITRTPPSTQNNGHRPMTYNPGEYCRTWDDKDHLQFSMETDKGGYGTTMPGGADLTATQGLPYREFTEVPGYSIKRYISWTSSSGLDVISLLVRYRVDPDPNANPRPPSLSFNRVAEISVEAQFWC